MNEKAKKFSHLLEPGRIGKLTIRNRVVMGPTETLYATSDGEITDKIIDFYVARAKGGCGLITVHSAQGATKVDKIDPYPGSIRVDDNMYIPDFFSVQLGRMSNVKIHPNSPITAENASQIQADTVLLCTSAEPLIPEIPGIHGEEIVTAQEVLLHEREVKGHAVICGGGQVGVETALELLERGCTVTIAEMLPELILKEELMTHIVMLKKLAAANVEILCQHKIMAFEGSRVKLMDMQSGQEKTIEADHVVIAFGTKPVNALQDAFGDKELIPVGDAKTPDTITAAINDGFWAAVEL